MTKNINIDTQKQILIYHLVIIPVAKVTGTLLLITLTNQNTCKYEINIYGKGLSDLDYSKIYNSQVTLRPFCDKLSVHFGAV